MDYFVLLCTNVKIMVLGIHLPKISLAAPIQKKNFFKTRE